MGYRKLQIYTISFDFVLAPICNRCVAKQEKKKTNNSFR